MRVSSRWRVVLGFTAALAAPLAHAEAGDYSFCAALKHLVSPAKAGNPVTPQQRVGEFPLKSNPPGFDDGFARGY